MNRRSQLITQLTEAIIRNLNSIHEDAKLPDAGEFDYFNSGLTPRPGSKKSGTRIGTVPVDPGSSYTVKPIDFSDPDVGDRKSAYTSKEKTAQDGPKKKAGRPPKQLIAVDVADSEFVAYGAPSNSKKEIKGMGSGEEYKERLAKIGKYTGDTGDARIRKLTISIDLTGAFINTDKDLIDDYYLYTLLAKNDLLYIEKNGELNGEMRINEVTSTWAYTGDISDGTVEVAVLIPSKNPGAKPRYNLEDYTFKELKKKGYNFLKKGKSNNTYTEDKLKNISLQDRLFRIDNGIVAQARNRFNAAIKAGVTLFFKKIWAPFLYTEDEFDQSGRLKYLMVTFSPGKSEILLQLEATFPHTYSKTRIQKEFINAFLDLNGSNTELAEYVRKYAKDSVQFYKSSLRSPIVGEPKLTAVTEDGPFSSRRSFWTAYLKSTLLSKFKHMLTQLSEEAKVQFALELVKAKYKLGDDKQILHKEEYRDYLATLLHISVFQDEEGEWRAEKVQPGQIADFHNMEREIANTQLLDFLAKQTGVFTGFQHFLRTVTSGGHMSDCNNILTKSKVDTIAKTMKAGNPASDKKAFTGPVVCEAYVDMLIPQAYRTA